MTDLFFHGRCGIGLRDLCSSMLDISTLHVTSEIRQFFLTNIYVTHVMFIRVRVCKLLFI